MGRILSETSREAARLRAQRWRASNREAHRAYTRAYWAARREEKNRKNAEWAAANPDKIKKYNRKYRTEHAERCRTSARNWRTTHPDKKLELTRTRRARRLRVGGRFTAKEWLAILERYGHRCLCCGRTDSPLSADHVIPISLGGRHEASNIQPLCIPCNSAKGIKTTDYR